MINPKKNEIAVLVISKQEYKRWYSYYLTFNFKFYYSNKN